MGWIIRTYSRLFNVFADRCAQLYDCVPRDDVVGTYQSSELCLYIALQLCAAKDETALVALACLV